MLIYGKRPGQSLVATNVSGHHPSNSRLFYITDNNTSLKFLVDTGAKVSLIPPSSSERKYPQDGFWLQAAKQLFYFYHWKTLTYPRFLTSALIPLGIRYC